MLVHDILQKQQRSELMQQRRDQQIKQSFDRNALI